ncbi:pseudouridine synthase [Fomitopsis serialis]|uniref:pseudouridine synthase n=1 Tax=Fomitopsis serialis TaxID=139415 RepID=UPI00200832CE|nr:pseudouridine synthase [Neoantrodia serialis]KAH9921645.1 pseudouridine synthase [Neoantrodia serialis]
MLAGRLARPLAPLFRCALACVRRSSTASTPIPVLYLDKGVIVVNKPSGFLCQYNKTQIPMEMFSDMRRLRMTNEVQRAYNMPELPYVVHRLDKASQRPYLTTTGALIFATSNKHAASLAMQFRQRSVKKTYLAIVRAGSDSLPQRSGVIQGIMQKLKGTGGPITTNVSSEWELLATSPLAPLSLVAVRPKTGFKHQIRVHMGEVLGAPVLGDTKYTGTLPPDPSIASAVSIPNDLLFLHAAEVSFLRFRPSGPHKKVVLTICAPLPDTFIPLPDKYIRGGLYIDGRQY